MEVSLIKLAYHNRGKWVLSKNPQYVGGKKLVENGDIDFLSFPHMIKKYKEEFGMTEVNKLVYLKPGKKLSDNALMILDSDDGINDIVASVLEMNYDGFIHIYPHDDLVLKHNKHVLVDEMVVNQPFSSTEASVNLVSEGDDLGVKNSEIDEGAGLQGVSQPTLSTQTSVNLMGEDPALGLNTTEGVGLEGGRKVVNLDKGKQLAEESDSGSSYTELDSSECESGDLSGDSSSESGDSGFDDDDNEVEMQILNQSQRTVKYDGDEGNPFFLLGMTFANAEEARLAIARYSVARSTPLKLNPNEKGRIRAQCKSAGCPFYLWMSYVQNKPPLVVKKFNSEHNCLKDAKNSLASARFLAQEFKKTINEKPTTTVKELLKTAEDKMHLYVSKSTAKRAKSIVRHELDGSYIDEFAKIGAYLGMCKETNPGSTIELELNEEALHSGKFIFRRLYMCFEALKRGWKAGCRQIIGLDGCHLKGIVKGQVLTAVGKDASDQIFPIAWAVIDKENIDNWKWFLELLVSDLEIGDRGRSMTVISDMQKGLVHAVGDVLPLAEHRYCARHVHANWSKKWHSGELKKKFWACVWSTFKEEFDDNLKMLGSISQRAAEDFVAYNPQFFCKAFFSNRSKSDACDNNLCESFNASIREARFKPIISMLDEIREAAMGRLGQNKEAMKKWATNWSPACLTRYQESMDKAFGCKVVFNGDHEYEVGDGDDRHVVRTEGCMCTCRVWDVTGIPCSYAICALNYEKKDPKQYISFWYEKAAYAATYQHPIKPMMSLKYLRVDDFARCEPPPTVRLSGRPRVKRMRSGREKMKGKPSGNLTKRGVVIKCSICHVAGHNAVTCPDKGKSSKASEGKGKGKATDAKGKSKLKEASSEGKGKRKATDVPKCIRKSRRVVGMGLHVDDVTGNSTLNPGMSSETMIHQSDPIASQSLSSDPDPVTRFPVPNQRELRQEQRASRSSASRRIAFAATGTQAIMPSNLPFKPPGPTWKGLPCTSTGALEKQRDAKKKKLKN